MDMQLRTVVYLDKLEIENVPIYSCELCQKSELVHEIKSEVTELLGDYGDLTHKQFILFDEHNEFAHMICTAQRKENQQMPWDQLINERINQLLDLLNLAKSMQDEQWQQDILRRLSQITTYSVSSV